MDENIINLGINGATNLTVNRTQSPDRWPFDKAGTPATVNPDPAKGKNKFGCNFSINTNLYKIVSAKIEDSHIFNFHKLPFNFQ